MTTQELADGNFHSIATLLMLVILLGMSFIAV